MITDITFKGPLLLDTGIPGEQKKDGQMPTSAQCCRLSRDRWLLLSYTRGFTGTDDDRSIFYQLRADAPDGPLLREAPLTLCRDDWEPFGPDGGRYFKVHGHAKLFGVPKGARLNGQAYPSANIFLASWYTYAKPLDDGNRVLDHSLLDRSLYLEQVHFRLNDDEDDIDLLTQPKPARPVDHDPGHAFTGFAGGRTHIEQWLATPLPTNAEKTSWIEMAHFNSRVAAMQYIFNAQTARYEWRATGPAQENRERTLSEASVQRLGDGYVVAVRTGRLRGLTGWCRTTDPLRELPVPTYVETPATWGPRVANVGPDGVLRILSGDIALSPYGEKRNPLFIWDVDPHDFSVSNRRVLFDARAAGLPLRTPFVGFPKFFPAQGNRQLVAFRVTVPNKTRESEHGDVLRPEELAAAGCYYAEITYDREAPPAWEFA
jgi:hypothetical protein